MNTADVEAYSCGYRKHEKEATGCSYDIQGPPLPEEYPELLSLRRIAKPKSLDHVNTA
jgi:hypothetical protein